MSKVYEFTITQKSRVKCMLTEEQVEAIENGSDYGSDILNEIADDFRKVTDYSVENSELREVAE